MSQNIMITAYDVTEFHVVMSQVWKGKYISRVKTNDKSL